MVNPNSTQPGSPRATPRGAKVVSSGSYGNPDAIELLKGDHRQVEGWFAEFEAAEDPLEKEELAASICLALSVHADIEEEIFYPAFLEAVGDEDLYEEALDEHDEAKDVIEEIEALGPGDTAQLDAKVRKLAALIKHHVQEEEQAGGMFDKASQSDMDLEEIGAQLEQRKLELMSDESTDEGYDEAVRQGGSGDSIDEDDEMGNEDTDPR
jgi:hypothetical protein